MVSALAAARTTDIRAMDTVYYWLRDHQPPEGPASLVHNDYKLDNVMLAHDDPGTLVAIFDWDMCTLGDPLADLGALLAYWSEPDDLPERRATAMMPTGDATTRFFSRAALIQRYAERSGRDVAHISFYHALGLFRVAVIVAQIYIRWVRGQTHDARFEAFGALAGILAQAAQDVTEHGS